VTLSTSCKASTEKEKDKKIDEYNDKAWDILIMSYAIIILITIGSIIIYYNIK